MADENKPKERFIFQTQTDLPEFPRWSKCPHCNAEAIQEAQDAPWLCLNPDCPSELTAHHDSKPNLS